MPLRAAYPEQARVIRCRCSALIDRHGVTALKMGETGDADATIGLPIAR